MKLLNKILTVGLSLVMCAGMTAPAFAVDAYYYVEVENPNKCPDIVVNCPNPEDEDNQRPDNKDLTGNGMNGDWAFMGAGEVDGETLVNLELGMGKNDTVEFGENGLPEGFELPPEGTQTFENGVYHNPGQEPGAELESVTVDTFHDIGQYEYDNGESAEAAGQFTYTIVWDNVEAQTGFNLNGSECTGMEYDKANDWSAYYNQNIEFDTGEVNCVHVNGTATLHENAALTVVVENNGQNAVTTSDGKATKYVRDTEKITEPEGKARVDAIASADGTKGLSGIAEEDRQYYDLNVEQSEDGKSVTATYTEQTYNVTYRIDGNQGSGVDVSGNDGTYGKVTGKWVIASTIDAVGGAGGTYSFSNWTVTTDADGNKIVTAVCTFTPYYVDPGDTDDGDDGDTGTTIDDAIVPLAEGPVTRAEFINYLWEHEGRPASAGVCTFTDVENVHAYFDALCWAEESGVAEAYVDAEGHEDGTFEPDELITVGAARAFLDNFANVFGTNAVAAADLTSLIGEDDEPVFNCGEVLAEFFGEEYAAAEGSGAETAA